ncbi:hypothetical protein C8J95_111117 [Elizabethkingia sp. YR214]|uniref:metalloprotease n=1 Tax=Elizabethkingia sp. YR214 TaxID=2135667 RepID=UPI000D30C76C|nr:metalloprotease [Elizabethkingia sp. YR214]PUB26433.1 hypothetical protein C8J95_111117 [Elizabethkingia sp. YR214]
MKKKIILLLLTGVLLTSCNRENETIAPEQSVTDEAFMAPTSELLCNYVDSYWPFSAVLKSGLKTVADTNFMLSEIKKNASLWGEITPPLKFVYAPRDPEGTYNAASYADGKIYYGYEIYYDAKSKSADNIVNAMILAHEYGHQLQYKYALPSVKEETVRSTDLEADGFAGYYLRKPAGFNKSNFSQIAAAYEFAAAIGDNQITSKGHHGTPAQRRTAVRLGFLLGEFTLTAKDFDSQFFHYYSSVLNGTDPDLTPSSASTFKFNQEIDRKIQAHMSELKDIYTEKISAEQFKTINTN